MIRRWQELRTRAFLSVQVSIRLQLAYAVSVDKLFQRRWYALVRHITRDSLFALSFDRIIDILLTEEPFKIAKDFDAQS